MPTIPIISIVDDDAWARSGLEDLVLSLGYRARSFESAEHFMRSGNITDTDCLITDLRMPGLSGLELQSYLRGAGHPTPVIFITSYPDGDQRDRALKDGAIAFLEKPCDEGALVACLARALRGTEPSAAADR